MAEASTHSGAADMEAVAAGALRAAAETITGVRARSCRLLDVGAAGMEVRLDIHAPADAPLPGLAARVRERVWEAAERELGLPVAAVGIHVTDLVRDRSGPGQEVRT
ncbi:hypothetical protein ACFXKY_17615 [Streptomyces canus]|uniref:hypothetical protein n=1 Tax=Streptomyces canus TaxID=58343 RepID=UPI0036A76698